MARLFRCAWHTQHSHTHPPLNTLLLSDAIMQDKANEGTKSQMLADMLILQRGSKVVLGMGGKDNA